ncbi:MAG TPA: MerR family DNA-binding transcriptional regulator, partial [Trebonia sp.]
MTRPGPVSWRCARSRRIPWSVRWTRRARSPLRFPWARRLDLPAGGRCTVGGVSETAEPCTIGGAARRVGVPARTIRFWCDSGVLPPAERSAGGYRRFDAAAIARL